MSSPPTRCATAMSTSAPHCCGIQRLAFERVAERVGLRHPVLEDDLADLDVPERAGVVEPAFAKREHQHEPDAKKEDRFRPEQAGHSRITVEETNSAFAGI